MKQGSKKAKVLLGACGCAQAEAIPRLVQKILNLDLGETTLDIVLVATQSSLKFFDYKSVAKLIGRPMFVEHTDYTSEFDVPHIQLGLWADLVIIYPASANTIARCAHGMTDSLLSNIVLAAKCPVFFAPFMNEAMLNNPVTQHNLKQLKKWGYKFIRKEKGNVFIHATKTNVVKEYCTENAVLTTIFDFYKSKSN